MEALYGHTVKKCKGMYSNGNITVYMWPFMVMMMNDNNDWSMSWCSTSNTDGLALGMRNMAHFR